MLCDMMQMFWSICVDFYSLGIPLVPSSLIIFPTWKDNNSKSTVSHNVGIGHRFVSSLSLRHADQKVIKSLVKIKHFLLSSGADQPKRANRLLLGKLWPGLVHVLVALSEDVCKIRRCCSQQWTHVNVSPVDCCVPSYCAAFKDNEFSYFPHYMTF